MSKRIPLPVLNSAPGQKPLWRSVGEYQKDPSVEANKTREFPDGASELPAEGASRRDFLKFLGLSTAAVGLEGCVREPTDKIMPYTKRPADVTPGNPLSFATAIPFGGYSVGSLVTSWEGRPTKVEGNPDHPDSLGATAVWQQAAIAQLYDRDRARAALTGGKPSSRQALFQAIAATAEKAKADGTTGKLRFLTEPSASPMLGELRRRITEAWPGAKFYSYATWHEDHVREGTTLAFGAPFEPRYDFKAADVVLSLDADFLDNTPAGLRHMHDFASRRVPEQPMNRLYVVEPTFTPTGSMADHRLRLRAGDVYGFALAVLSRLKGSGPLAAVNAAEPQLSDEAKKFADVVAKDLAKAGARAVVLAGERQPREVHAIAHALNAALGAAGSVVKYQRSAMVDPASGPASLKALVEEMRSGAVDTLVITAWNPVYAAPADLDFQSALARVKQVVYLGLYHDETAALATTFVPAAHPLEAWGDGRATDGTVTLQQPLIDPLFNGTSELELLAAFVGQAEKGAYTLLKEYWAEKLQKDDFETYWLKLLATGVIENTASPAETVGLDAGRLAGSLGAPAAPGGLELDFALCAKVHDGRFGNNGWLQELPEPMTKIVWDNVAMVSPATAREKGLINGDVVELSANGKTVKAPTWIMPGHADGAVTLTLGYGRKGAELVAAGVGFDAGQLRSSASPFIVGGADLKKTGDQHEIVVTQEHWSMEGREPAVEATPETLPEMAEHLEERRTPPKPMQEPVKYDTGYKWGLAIDMSRCTGCSACVIACQAENNIPIVGKDQVERNREMHWLRIDRYFTGESLDSPGIALQPMMCVHCETAPCEYVCPVNATVHSDEGLNEMVYNRCIGTRYCSNNCPYKVRRFNFLAYNAHRTALDRMMANPDVTVRSRGVMEKCTYCVQRIERARIDTRIQNRTIKDGELRTACQQSCPAQAIVFGDLNDKGSAVAKLHEDKRSYFVLNELSTRPRTTYLARIRNPNPELA